jgi:ABC-2 type transport system permease protein
VTVRDARTEPGRIGRAQLRGMLALCEREVLRVLRLWTQTIAPQVVAATLFIVVFGIALGGRINTIDGVQYEHYIVPGLALMGVATAAFANNATSLYQARAEGFIEDPVSSPMSATQLSVAYTVGGVVRGLLIGAATLAVAGIIVGFPVEHPLHLAAAMLLAALAFAGLGTVVGLLSKGWEMQAFFANLVIQPLVFLGGVFYSVAALRSPWDTVSHFDPLLYMVDSARYGTLGVSDVSPWAAFGVSAALTAVTLTAAWVLFARGVGLRT